MAADFLKLAKDAVRRGIPKNYKPLIKDIHFIGESYHKANMHICRDIGMMVYATALNGKRLKHRVIVQKDLSVSDTRYDPILWGTLWDDLFDNDPWNI